MASVGDGRNKLNSEGGEEALMTRKQFLLETGWTSWFPDQTSEMGGRESLSPFLPLPSLSTPRRVP